MNIKAAEERGEVRQGQVLMSMWIRLMSIRLDVNQVDVDVDQVGVDVDQVDVNFDQADQNRFPGGSPLLFCTQGSNLARFSRSGNLLTN